MVTDRLRYGSEPMAEVVACSSTIVELLLLAPLPLRDQRPHVVLRGMVLRLERDQHLAVGGGIIDGSPERRLDPARVDALV